MGVIWNRITLEWQYWIWGHGAFRTRYLTTFLFAVRLDNPRPVEAEDTW